MWWVLTLVTSPAGAVDCQLLREMAARQEVAGLDASPAWAAVETCDHPDLPVAPAARRSVVGGGSMRLPPRAGPEVSRWLDWAKGKGRARVLVWLQRAAALSATVLPGLGRHGLSQDFLAVAMAESGFDPGARSPAGALGVWQLMPATARHYGLEVGRSVDERTDVARATDAAARLLVELHRRYGDWELALAAYNAGSGRVDRAVGGGPRTFQAAAPRLPTETREYVPRVLAFARVLDDPAGLGLPPVRLPGPVSPTASPEAP